MKTRVLLVFALIAVVSPACWALGTTRQTTTSLVFNFDSGSPALSPGRPTPFNQTVANVTATFSSILDPSAFSVQRYETTFFVLSEFSGNYLYDNKLATRSVDIRFDANLTSIEFAFATPIMSQNVRIASGL